MDDGCCIICFIIVFLLTAVCLTKHGTATDVKKVPRGDEKKLLFMHGLPREPVKPREDPALGLRLEVHDPAHRAIVLALGPVEMNAGHFPLGKVHLANVRDPPRLQPHHCDESQGQLAEAA